MNFRHSHYSGCSHTFASCSLESDFSLVTESKMKFSIILFLVAVLGSRDMLVSSQNEEHHSPAYEVKDAAEHEGNLRGSLVVRALFFSASNSSDSVDSIDSTSNSTSNSDSSDSNDSVDSISDSTSSSNSTDTVEDSSVDASSDSTSSSNSRKK